VNGQELHDFLRDARTPWDIPILTVDEDGFVREIVEIITDPETGDPVFRLEIKK
jgi:hypothetical protein